MHDLENILTDTLIKIIISRTKSVGLVKCLQDRLMSSLIQILMLVASSDKKYLDIRYICYINERNYYI